MEAPRTPPVPVFFLVFFATKIATSRRTRQFGLFAAKTTRRRQGRKQSHLHMPKNAPKVIQRKERGQALVVSWRNAGESLIPAARCDNETLARARESLYSRQSLEERFSRDRRKPAASRARG
jgi:hypothetical protein